MTVSLDSNNYHVIINANLSEFRIGFEQTSYTVNETIGMLEVCARMFEPSEDISLGSVSISIGAETVQGSAGIVCRDYTYFITVHCHLFDSQM